MAFSLASPLAKFLNGLEILLSKAQVSPTLPFLSSLDLSKSCLMGCVVFVHRSVLGSDAPVV